MTCTQPTAPWNIVTEYERTWSDKGYPIHRLVATVTAETAPAPLPRRSAAGQEQEGARGGAVPPAGRDAPAGRGRASRRPLTGRPCASRALRPSVFTGPGAWPPAFGPAARS